jgi:hypothetical protein
MQVQLNQQLFLYLNGQSVDPSRKLDPGWTTYEKRTLFATYDLSTTLKV